MKQYPRTINNGGFMYQVTHKINYDFDNHSQNFLNFKTKKSAIDYLRQIYLEDHVPFFELDSQGKLDSFPFNKFLKDFTIEKVYPS
jgi:hypothetical protein